MGKLFGGTPELVIAYWVAIATLLLALCLLSTILLLRVRAQRRERRNAEAMRHWTQVFRDVLDGRAAPLRPLQREETPGFVEAWNALHETLPERDSQRLAALGERVGLAAATRPLLRGGYHDRAMAIIALGHLRDARGFDAMAPFLTDRSPIVSLCAARALSQIDPPRAMALFVPLILEREDWVPGSVARILAENRDGSAARELSNGLLRANADTTVKLVRFLADIDPARAAGVIRDLLEGPVDDHVKSVCLQLVSDPADRARVRGLLAAERWHVRMHAASALGRIGEDADRARLEPLLSDSVWWVRYRAAQALLALSGGGEEALRNARERSADAYGRGIIDHVLAERQMRSAT